MKFAINAFARRQTAESKFSHFGGTDSELLALVAQHFAEAEPGYRDGVVLVPVPPDRFFSGVVQVTTETPLKAVFEARQDGEAPYIDVVATDGSKLPAKNVRIVLYRNDVLGPDASTVAEWEIVSLNASASDGPEPLTPMAMARNMLGLVGGTNATYTAEQFAQAIIYWSTRAMRG